MSAAAAIVYFICCHGGPAAHFSEFAQELSQNGYRVEVLATGPAFDKFGQLKIDAIECNPEKLDLDDPASQKLLAAQIANHLQSNQTIITDVGHPFLVSVQEAVAKLSPKTKRFAYYDNPEPFVPGGYSTTAARVMAAAQKTLFTNQHLAQEPMELALPLSQRVGIGYYPVQAAIALKNGRKERQQAVRQEFFARHNLVDCGQKVLVYFGGNNEVYFEKAFPAFLTMLREANLDPSRYLCLLQQHPGAKGKNIDRKLAEKQPQLVLSELSSEEAQILADAALYYQTSMGPQFAIARIPTIQVGHETYSDILVRSGLAPSATSPESLATALQRLSERSSQPTNEDLLEALGVDLEWANRLYQAIY